MPYLAGEQLISLGQPELAGHNRTNGEGGVRPASAEIRILLGLGGRCWIRTSIGMPTVQPLGGHELTGVFRAASKLR